MHLPNLCICRKLNERSIVLAASMPLMQAIVKVERDKPAVQESRVRADFLF